MLNFNGRKATLDYQNIIMCDVNNENMPFPDIFISCGPISKLFEILIIWWMVVMWVEGILKKLPKTGNFILKMTLNS